MDELASEAPPAGGFAARLLGRTTVRYLVTGGIGYTVNLVVFAGAIAATVDPYVALLAAFLANTASNFVLNRYWTFGGDAPLLQSLARYSVLALGLLALNYATFHGFHGIFGLPPVPAQGLAIIVGLPVGFLASRMWAFRGPDPASGRAGDASRT